MFSTSENAMFDRYEPHDKREPHSETECPYEVYSSIDIDEVFGFETRGQALEYIEDYRKRNIGEDGEFTDCLVLVHGAEFEIYPASTALNEPFRASLKNSKTQLNTTNARLCA